MAINYIAVFAAALASWIAGAVWYSALAKPWTAALGWNASDQSKSPRAAPMIICFAAELIMAFTLAGLIGHFGPAGLRSGLITGALCWLGFVATTIAVNNAFQKRPAALTIIDAGHWLVVLLAQGAVIGLFG